MLKMDCSRIVKIYQSRRRDWHKSFINRFLIPKTTISQFNER